MGIHWPKLFMKAVFWICAEVALTCLGLDDIADYSEFVTQDRSAPAIEMAHVAHSIV